jgi:hypothetical protein
MSTRAVRLQHEQTNKSLVQDSRLHENPRPPPISFSCEKRSPTSGNFSTIMLLPGTPKSIETKCSGFSSMRTSTDQ